MPIIDDSEIDSCLEKCRTREQELISELNAIRSQIKGLQSIKIEIFKYDDPKTGETINQENKQIDELTGEPISDTRRQELYDKLVPAVQAM